MSAVLSPNTNNLSMPRGRLSFAPINASGVMTGEVDLGNVESFDLNPKFNYKDHFTSRGPQNCLDASHIAQIEMEVKFTPQERSRENMAMFFLGNPDSQKSAGGGSVSQVGAVHTVSVDVHFDRWVDLGYLYINAIVEGSFSINLGNTVSLSSYTAGSDYRIDLETGRLMIISTGRIVNDLSLTDGDAVACTFKCGTAVSPRFTQALTPIIGFLRYVGMSAVGPRHHVKLWKVQIYPDSAMSLIKPGDYAGLSFSGKVFIDDDAGNHPTLPFGDITELVTATAFPS